MIYYTFELLKSEIRTLQTLEMECIQSGDLSQASYIINKISDYEEAIEILKLNYKPKINITPSYTPPAKDSL